MTNSVRKMLESKEAKRADAVHVRYESLHVEPGFNLRQQDLAVKSGHWPLLRYDPRLRAQGRNPLSVDSAAPSIPYRDFAQHEARFTVLERLHPADANRLMNEAESAARSRHQEYTELAALALPGSATTAAEENKNA